MGRSSKSSMAFAQSSSAASLRTGRSSFASSPSAIRGGTARTASRSIPLLELLLEDCEALRERDVLVDELRDGRRVVEQHEEDEEHRHGEQHRRRVRLDAEPVCDRRRRRSPDRKHEQYDPRDEPEQRVALLQAPLADQLEHDEHEQHGGDCARDREGERRHRVSPGTAWRRKSATKSASSTFARKYVDLRTPWDDVPAKRSRIGAGTSTRRRRCFATSTVASTSGNSCG